MAVVARGDGADLSALFGVPPLGLAALFGAVATGLSLGRLVRSGTAHAEILPGCRAARATATHIRAALISCTKVQP